VKIRAKEVVLWRNKDVLLDVELFHARTSSFSFPNLLSLVFILWQPRFPKCLYRKREKLTKNADFSKTVGPFPIFYGGKWDTGLFDVFTSVVKEYNIRRHYETHHAQRYLGLQGQPRREKVKELIADLKKRQSIFASGPDISAAAVKASYLIANDIALASKPYCEGEFVKTCILKAAEIVCPEKRQVFANISLTRNTVTERISDLSANLDSQLKNKVKSFVTFSFALDESTDISDVAQLAIFIRGVDETLSLRSSWGWCL